MTHSSITELNTLLSKLENLSKKMADILLEEQTLLNASDAKKLIELAKQKKQIVTLLEQSTRVTHKFLLALNIKNGLYGLSEFIEQQSDDVKAVLQSTWLSTKKTIQHNKHINDINGSIIELNRRFTQRSLDVLRGQIGPSNETYGANGQSHKSTISRNISIA